jgi:hypothetical protein
LREDYLAALESLRTLFPGLRRARLLAPALHSRASPAGCRAPRCRYSWPRRSRPS